MPALLLQPLVENSIRHGLEPQLAGGRVEVTAVREGDALLVRVRDSGVGLTAMSAGSGSSGDSSAGFGLSHVRERLATLYGARAGLTVEAASDADGGTLVTVRLPFQRSSGSSPATPVLPAAASSAA